MRITVTEKVRRHIEQLIDRGDLVAGSLLPSEREVAENLGVARGTVRQAISQLVNSGRLVSAARQGTVVAGALGSSAASASGASRRSAGDDLWSVIVPSVDYFYPQLVDAIEREAAACGKRVLLACSRSNRDTEKQLIDDHIGQGAKGIFLAPVVPPIDAPPVRRDYLAALPVPVVILDHSSDELPDADVVLSDNFSGAYDATVHLLRSGRKRPVLVRPGVNTRIAEERVEGYRTAMDDHGCAAPDVPPMNAHDIIQNRVDVIRSVVEAGADAFVALNDHTACTLLRHLARLGVSVPSQVAVVGYDDEAIASIAEPPLTTVRVNKSRMASLAVQALRERLEKRTEGRYRHLRVRPTLIVRESCGARRLRFTDITEAPAPERTAAKSGTPARVRAFDSASSKVANV